MFDSSYKFRYIQSNAIAGELFLKRHLLTFTCRFNHRYIVEVEEYEHEIFAIKFYLKAHADSSNRYKLLTHLNDAPKVFRTCIDIMLYFLERQPQASFIFLGAQLQTEKNEKNTKRFRVYKRIMENFFKPTGFAHYMQEESSIHLILNHLQIDKNPNILKEIEKTILEYYETGSEET